MRLFEIDQRIHNILERLYDHSVFHQALSDAQGETEEPASPPMSDADLQKELLEELDALKTDRDNMLSSLHSGIRYYESLADVLGDEIKRLQARKKTIESHTDRVKRFVMWSIDGKKWTNGIRTFWTQQTLKVEVKDPMLLPPKFQKKTELFEPRKDELGKEYKAWYKRLVVHQKEQSEKRAKDPTYMPIPFQEPRPSYEGVQYLNNESLRLS